MRLLSNSTLTEKTILGTSALLMLLALFFFMNEQWYSRLTGNTDLETQFTSLGRIDSSKNDVRYKEGRRFDWQNSKIDQNIFVGDSVFVGPNSQAQVRLNGKNDLHLGENSLVKFSNYNGKTLSDLLAGNFRLQIDGQVQIAINGQVTTLKGDGSEVQVYFDKKNQPKMKLIKGEVTVTKIANLGTKKTAKKKLVEPIYEKPQEEVKLTVANIEQPLVESPPEPTYYFPPEPVAETKLVTHIWKIRDVYEQAANAWKLRKVAPQKVDHTFTFNWTDGDQGPYDFAYGSVENFDSRMTNVMKAQEKSYTTSQVYLGENYWRVSRDGKEWSKGANFVVVPSYNQAIPQFSTVQTKLWLIDGKTEGAAAIEWSPAPEQTGAMVEVSTSETFAPESTQIYFKSQALWPGSFTTAGVYYFRLRGVNSQQELSEYSQVHKVAVEVPSLLSQPLLPLAQLRFIKGQKNLLNWKAPIGTQSFAVKVFNRAGEVVQQSEQAQSQLKLEDLPIGQFNYQVVAIDRWGRAGETSRAKSFSIQNPPQPKRVLASQPPPPPPTPAPTPEPEPEPEPLPVQRSAEVVAKFRPEATPEPQLPYARSLVQIEGASLGVTSSEQLTYGTGLPLLGTLGVRAQVWKDRLGTELSAKMKAFSYNAEAERVSPTHLEARIHRRWTLPLRWFSFLRELQVSVFGGAEVYRNSQGSNLYSTGYELAKAGAALKFPLGRRWESGGELAYGLGLESSRKYEASGNLSYLFKPQWSLGVGYRVHYFEAGSQKATPFILPYREAQGEAFSMLRYSY